jgi:nitrite reductase (NO-forming)
VETGSFHNPPQRDLQTWFIRGGSAGAALYTFRQPGIYAYLSHNLIEAVELGAVAHFKVDGQWTDDLMKQVSPPQPIVADEVPNEKSN